MLKQKMDRESVKFVKKPVVIRAFQTEEELIIPTLEGDHKANIGDWIIEGIRNELYPCKPDIFEKTYELASKTREFHLHSKGKNWVHFRKNLDSICESFSVTFLHDGTCVMSGDYGTLVWRRNFNGDNMDIGFPSKETGIDYFAEKCTREDQLIKTWKKEKALEDIKEALKDESNKEKVQDCLDDVSSCCEDEGQAYELKMYEIVSDKFPDYEWAEHRCGECHKDYFIFQFEVLKSVSKQIVEALGIEVLECPI